MWRTITLDDIAATLSQAELDAFRRSAADTGADPVEALIARTAETVRGFCRSNPALRLSPAPSSLPVALISPACDYAAFDILKRMNLPVKEPRQRARDAAVALFQRVAEGKFTPESYAAPGESPPDPHTLPVYSSEPRLL